MSAPDPVAAINPSSESRKRPRTRVFWRVLVVHDKGERLPCHTWDLSEEGMSFSSPCAFPTGSRLHLALFVPVHRANEAIHVCELDARVCYQVLKSDLIHTGVQFLNPSPAVQEWIRSGLRLVR